MRICTTILHIRTNGAKWVGRRCWLVVANNFCRELVDSGAWRRTISADARRRRLQSSIDRRDRHHQEVGGGRLLLEAAPVSASVSVYSTNKLLLQRPAGSTHRRPHRWTCRPPEHVTDQLCLVLAQSEAGIGASGIGGGINQPTNFRAKEIDVDAPAAADEPRGCHRRGQRCARRVHAASSSCGGGGVGCGCCAAGQAACRGSVRRMSPPAKRVAERVRFH